MTELAEVPLLLTAAVEVNAGLPGQSSHDPVIRQSEYVATLRHYLLGAWPRKIVLAEGSGWPLAAFQRAVDQYNHLGKVVELLQLSCNKYPPAFGKGYGEATLLDRALDASAVLLGCPLVAKMTGRQRVLNMADIIARAKGNFKFLCDLRDHDLYAIFRLPGAGHYCDTRFFVFETKFFGRHFRTLHLAHEPSRGEFNLEEAYYRAIASLPLLERSHCLTRFPREPRYRGSAGHWGKDYGSLGQRMKQEARAILRLLLPTLHF